MLPTNSRTHRGPPLDVPVSPSPTTATSPPMNPPPPSGPVSSRQTPSIIFQHGFAETVGYLTSQPQEQASSDDEEPPLTPQATAQSGTSSVTTSAHPTPEVETQRLIESGYTGLASRFAPSALTASSPSVTASNSHDATTAAVSDNSGDVRASSEYPAFESSVSSAPYIPLGGTPPASALSSISTGNIPRSIARPDESIHPSEAVEGEDSLSHERSHPYGQGRSPLLLHHHNPRHEYRSTGNSQLGSYPSYPQYYARQDEPEAIDEQGSSTQPQARYDADGSLNATRFPASQRRSAHRSLRVASDPPPSLSHRGDRLMESDEETDDIYEDYASFASDAAASQRDSHFHVRHQHSQGLQLSYPPANQPRSYWSPDTSVRNSMSADSVEGTDILEEGAVAPTADEHEHTGGPQGYIAAVARAAATEVNNRLVRDPAELIGMINHFVGAFADRIRNVGESGLRIWTTFFPSTPIQRFGQARNPNPLLPRFNHPLQHRWETIYTGPSPFDDYPHCILIDFIMPDVLMLTPRTGLGALHHTRSWKLELGTTTVLLQWRQQSPREIVMIHAPLTPLQGNESDTLNESYICFRRQEIKAVRKTRQAQTTYSDKLVHLQAKFTYPLELAKLVLQREKQKKECSSEAQAVWLERMALADVRRKFPTFAEKGDEELLVDKERPKKTEVVYSSSSSPSSTTRDCAHVSTNRHYQATRAYAQVKSVTEAILAKQKEADRSWEDVIDNPYQQQPVPYASRLFQYVPPSDTASGSSSNSDKTADSDDEHASKMAKVSRAVRLRYGRGGRLLMNRRDSISHKPVSKAARSSLFASADDDKDDMQVDEEDPEEQERSKRLEEKWRFDSDDALHVAPRLRYSMSVLTEADHIALTVDPILHLPTADGRQTAVLPYRLGMQQMVRRDAQGNLRSHTLQPMLPPNHALALQANIAGAVAAGTPVTMQHQIKKMPPPTAVPQMRISSNGGMRPPSTPVVASTSQQPQQPQQSAPTPPTPTQVPASQAVNGVSPATRPAIAMPHVEVVKPADPAANGAPAQPSTESAQTQDVAMNGVAPPRPKSQNQAPAALSVPANGYHLTPMTASNPAAAFARAHLQAEQRIPMTAQKIEQLKSAFGSLTPQELAALANNRALAADNYVNSNGAMHIPTTNVNLKLPPARQMQWAAMAGVGVQRPPSAVNGDAQSLQVNGVVAPTPAHIIPVRSPSANGVRTGISNGQLQMSSHLQHANTPSPMPNISQSQSPP
ncbi:hypothetical protein BKA70DRAFT_1220258 [Coprinopsis sp. MPI-PUGE-AT-0042]|nr:hypothetical protein BKA70DRAFT_1220258 [Coprinopsis sp. MPI-PUGE-AT-0042]